MLQLYDKGNRMNKGMIKLGVAAEFEKYASGAFFNEDTILLQYQFKL